MTFPKFHGITLANNSFIENCTVERLSSDPVPLTASRIWYNTTTKTLKFSSLDGGGAVIVEIVATGAQVATVVADLAALGARVDTLESDFINKDGSVAFTGDINAGTHKIINVTNGTASTDGVNFGQLTSAISALGNAFDYIGTVEGGATAPAAFDLSTLAATAAGKYYKVATAGYFVVGAGAAFFVNINDGLVFNTTAGVDVIDNTNSTVAGTAGFTTVTGSSDTGYTVDIASAFKTSVSDATAGLASEITRATAAEATLTTNLAAEVTRATSAEAAISTDLATEVTRATNAEAALSSAISSETTARVAADSTLTTNLAAEVTRATAAESTEATARAAADATLTADLAAEVTRATTAEAAVASDLSAEITRATAAEAAEATARAAADTTLTTDLAAEVTARTAADSTLTTNLAAEVTRATAAEGVIASDLAAEITRATAAESAEATARAAADTTLTTNLAAEVTRATAAESAEATARASADTTLQSNITAVDTKVGTLASLTTTDKSSIVNAINEVQAAAGSGTDTLRVKINDQRFTYLAGAPSLTHVISHSLNTGFASVMTWVKGDDTIFRNDIVAVEETDSNTVTVTLTESRIIKVTVQAMDDISA